MALQSLIAHPQVRASDDDREASLSTLREHWIAGRLTLDEYEERCDEVAQARYVSELAAATRELPGPWRGPKPPTGRREATASVVLGSVGLVGLVFSVGFLVLLTLPASVSAWVLGRRGRKLAGDGRTGLALTGEVLGVTGTVLGGLVLAFFALILWALF